MDIESAKKKIAKLLNLADPTRGAAANEAETALRQAQKLMEKFGIDLADIQSTDGTIKPEFVWDEGFYPFGIDGKFTKKNPQWFQWLASATAIFTDTIVRIRLDAHLGAGVSFHGTDQDVAFALWLISYLKDCVRRATRDAQLGSPQARETFRHSMSSTLSRRMHELRAARFTSTSKALVVVDDKLRQRNERFGENNFKKSKKRLNAREMEAIMKGQEYGERVNLSGGRPIHGSANQEKLT